MLTTLLRRRIPGQLVIQMTDRCNARCPQCGMRATEPFPRSSLSPDQIRQIIDAAARKKVQALSFTGGEPLLLLDDLLDLIRYAGAAGIPYLRTGTNGFHFTGSDRPGFEQKVHRLAERLARTPLRNFWISIDSALPEVHERMRGFPGVIRGIEKALPIFHSYGLYPSANLGINRNLSEETMKAVLRNGNGRGMSPEDFYGAFQSAFRSFYRRIIDLGFTIVNSCYPMSVEAADGELSAVYAASASDAVVKFTPGEKALIFKALMDTIPEYRSEIRIFSPRTSLHTLWKQYSGNGSRPYPCRGGIDFFFIDSRDGNTYPCGYRGRENLGRFHEVDLNSRSADINCLECDWECFRDPSELFGPLLQGLSSPLALAGKCHRDAGFFSLWMDDLKYYRACGLFDGRTPPDYHRMQRFRGYAKGR